MEHCIEVAFPIGCVVPVENYWYSDTSQVKHIFQKGERRNGQRQLSRAKPARGDVIGEGMIRVHSDFLLNIKKALGELYANTYFNAQFSYTSQGGSYCDQLTNCLITGVKLEKTEEQLIYEIRFSIEKIEWLVSI